MVSLPKARILRVLEKEMLRTLEPKSEEVTEGWRKLHKQELHQFNNPEDEDRDGLRNVGLYKTEPPYPADSPKKLHYTHSPGQHQIVYRSSISCTLPQILLQ
jgi:hypothetical protein